MAGPSHEQENRNLLSLWRSESCDFMILGVGGSWRRGKTKQNKKPNTSIETMYSVSIFRVHFKRGLHDACYLKGLKSYLSHFGKL